MWNVVEGALADNFGSKKGLFPLCLSPLAIEVYTKNFMTGDSMSVTGYQWLSVMVAFMVVPSTVIAPYIIFDGVRIASTCVIGNA